MKRQLFAAMFAAAAIVAACNQNDQPATATNANADPSVQGTPYTPPSTTSAEPQREPAIPSAAKDSVRRVNVDEAKQLIANGAVVVDVRAADAYKQGHIPGAINMPFATVEAQIPTLPKGKTVVAYCT